jgi:hypothetical protein
VKWPETACGRNRSIFAFILALLDGTCRPAAELPPLGGWRQGESQSFLDVTSEPLLEQGTPERTQAGQYND